jgi:HPt (histidine-containing phosphotransfer) domain-containing protein
MSGWEETYRGLQVEFVRASERRLEDMEALLHKLAEGDPGSQGPRWMEELARHFHSLKGAGASYGFPGISEKCRVAQEECRQLAGETGLPSDIQLSRWRDLVVVIRLELRAPAASPGPE